MASLDLVILASNPKRQLCHFQQHIRSWGITHHQILAHSHLRFQRCFQQCKMRSKFSRRPLGALRHDFTRELSAGAMPSVAWACISHSPLVFRSNGLRGWRRMMNLSSDSVRNRTKKHLVATQPSRSRPGHPAVNLILLLTSHMVNQKDRGLECHIMKDQRSL
ncbi:hypothetical protein KOR42_17070 [Thalassoglobus neptunius]|uniref:Uncharacterized protein n=1 Tax=Thalassoglobus neptunius TaxID=1938619 RepID=A0A5C5X7U5_9PLAN|nr:hypothetical protein KOR42_17070 [Thalassoglobus neptunius]